MTGARITQIDHDNLCAGVHCVEKKTNFIMIGIRNISAKNQDEARFLKSASSFELVSTPSTGRSPMAHDKSPILLPCVSILPSRVLAVRSDDVVILKL